MKFINPKIIFKPKYRQISFGTFIIGIIILCALIFQSYQAYQLEFSQAESLALNISLVLEQETKSAFRTMDILLLHVNKNIELRGSKFKWSKIEYDKLLKEEISFQPELQGLKIFDSEGGHLGSENGIPPKSSLADREYFQEHKKNENAGVIISKPVKSKTTGDWVIVLSRRLHSFDGKFKGVVLATLPLKYFEVLYNRLKLGAKGNISLFTLNDYHLMVRYPVIEKLIGKDLSTSPLYARIKAENKLASTLIEKSALDGEVKLHSFRIIKELNLIIITGLAKNDFLAGWYRSTAFLFILVNLAGLGFLIFFLNYLTYLDTLDENRIQLVRSNKLTSLGEMASGIAHEINNPLAIIHGKTDLMKRKIENANIDLEVFKKDLEKIIFTTDRISKIIKGLRSFSRNSEADPMSLVKVSQIIEDTLSFCTEKFKNNSIELITDIKTEASILCRASQISQVLMNLIGNAFDAVDNINIKWVKIEVLEDKYFVQFKITDSGLGISKDVVEKMMQPFFTTKEVGKGTGLGLSISKGIIEEHNGELFYDNNSKNTSFIFKLPINQKH